MPKPRLAQQAALDGVEWKELALMSDAERAKLEAEFATRQATQRSEQLPEGWCWASLDQLADVGTGATPKRGDPRYWSNGTVPWGTSGSLNQDRVSVATDYVTEEALAETNLTVFPAGTLVIAMYGEGRTRGQCSELAMAASTNQAIAAAVMHGPVDLKGCVKLFLKMNYELTRALASGGVQPNLNLSVIREIAVPLPPSSEQSALLNRASAALRQVELVGDSLRQSRNSASNLEQVCLAKAFRGELVEQDPNDEPRASCSSASPPNARPWVIVRTLRVARAKGYRRNVQGRWLDNHSRRTGLLLGDTSG